MDNRPIGMFDSGVGGLMVFKEVIKKLPNENIIYLGDTARFPYGSKSKEAIIEISRQCIKYLISKNVKLIIIACGTATSQSLETLQKEFEIPIIGIIEPSVLDMKKNSKENMKIGIMATAGTIRSNAWQEKILKAIPDAEVINRACPLLAPMAEEGWVNNVAAEFAIQEYTKDLRQVDKLVLGCTHYPMFESIIKRTINKNAEIINTGEKVANYVDEYLKAHKMQNNMLNKVRYDICFTDVAVNFMKVANNILDNEIEMTENVIEKNIKKVDIYEINN